MSEENFIEPSSISNRGDEEKVLSTALDSVKIINNVVAGDLSYFQPVFDGKDLTQETINRVVGFQVSHLQKMLARETIQESGADLSVYENAIESGQNYIDEN
jgi:hypothetical protein|tara:strand:+ start:6746 stop:7051 length:306 start_codon:yes stop_codon:yes gene_type:complete